MTLTAAITEREMAHEPAKRWRNRYWSDAPIEFIEGVGGPGEYFSFFVWPSREIAEQKAAEIMRKHAIKRPHITVKYLGAEPAP